MGALAPRAALGPLRPRWRAALAIVGAALACRCASPTSPSSGGSTVFVGAGDIANCALPGAAMTAALIDTIPGKVFTAGDNAYPLGAKANFDDCYDPTWGRFRDRTFPTPGNHDYDSPGAFPYFDYFGSRAGPRGLGYYRVTLGSWTILSLNSEDADVSEGSVQWNWLQQELVSSSSPRSSPQPPPRCTLAIWHKPLFSSGGHGNNTFMRDIWKVLYDFGADVVLNGHDHMYERFDPQDADGRRDDPRGIREFIVGTGGGELTGLSNLKPNSVLQLVSVYGVLKLTLSDGGYTWEFLPVTGGTADFGSGTCH
jgi:hypothetical protein